ncbi:F-box/kelch-repeat protein At3g23880-like [Lycium barbarum]|uniref:F-box/kelch-repeat protein At3g23880-like n=1 Tax=Lycium barbarum TaxID=112863 RepID=UPI00293E963B|nr:F-box/kelch-repeat protein At3g23880-like [Lycium barbarum]XP_060201211.1 F-box/kelch-repeat protein At3g23880-like [Lycium barbarum]
MISVDPPGDEMTNILSRLPVEDLMQFRSVCKSWCNLIIDLYFVNKHMNQHSSYKESSFLIGKDLILDVAEIKECCTLYSDETFAEHKKLEFPLWESTKSFEVLGCCNGVLFLLYPLSPRSCCKMYFWNPATKIVKNLINSPVQLPDFRVQVVFGFGWVPRLDEYKVVRILYTEKMNLTAPPKLPPVVEIYSLKTDSWTKIEVELSYFITSHMAKAFLDGSAYWVARNVINETEYDDFIVSFNMADHVFEEIKLPKSCLDDGALTGSLAVFRDSLYLFVHGPESLDWWHVWMMQEDCSRKIWFHQFKVDCSFKICWPLGFMKNGEVIFESIEGDLSLYDPRNEQFQDLRFQGNPDMIELFAYKESLVLLDLGTKSWPKEFHDDGNEELDIQT